MGWTAGNEWCQGTWIKAGSFTENTMVFLKIVFFVNEGELPLNVL